MKYLAFFGLYSFLIGVLELYFNILVFVSKNAHTIITSTFGIGIIGLLLGLIGFFKDQTKMLAILGIILNLSPILTLLYLFFINKHS